MAAMKAVASERNLPVQAGPGAAPDDDSFSSDGEPATGQSDARPTATVAIKAKIMEAATFAQARAVSARETAASCAKFGQVKLYSIAASAKETASGATDTVKSSLSKAAAGISERKALATEYLLSLKASSYARSQAMVTNVTDAAKSMRARTLKVYGETEAMLVSTLQSGRSKVIGSVKNLQASILERTAVTRSACTTTYSKASEQASRATTTAKAKAVEMGTAARVAAADPKMQCTAASAAGGAAALGATGGATGLAAGSTIGAAIGLVPALFTFGLSIPIGAALGGGTGLVVGTAVGSTVGAVGGGAAGYGVYSKKDDIRSGAGMAMTKANDCADYVKGKANASAGYAQKTASQLRERIASGITRAPTM